MPYLSDNRIVFLAVTLFFRLTRRPTSAVFLVFQDDQCPLLLECIEYGGIDSRSQLLNVGKPPSIKNAAHPRFSPKGTISVCRQFHVIQIFW
jgi:hypothetical protein